MKDNNRHDLLNDKRHRIKEMPSQDSITEAIYS